MQLLFHYTDRPTSFQIESNSLIINLKSITLGTRNTWNILEGVKLVEGTDEHLIFSSDTIIGGAYVAPVGKDLSEISYEIYSKIIKLAKGYHLTRAWNYIPGINDYIGQEEIYRLYNVGRSLAFYSAFDDPIPHLPAATGIDIIGDNLVVVFLANKNPGLRFENTLQVSSFDYPKEHGVKAPMFTRALRTRLHNKDAIFISGTASIRGHDSVFTEDEIRQLDTTMDNITNLISQMKVEQDFLRGNKYSTEKIIYIRNPESYSIVKAHIDKEFPLFSDGIYLQGNICRKDLDIEISLTAYEE